MKKSDCQIIEKDGKPAFAVIPFTLYNKLFAKDEVVKKTKKTTKIQAVSVNSPIENVSDIPTEVLELMSSKKWTLIKAWRRYKKVSQAVVAKKLKVSHVKMASIENDKSLDDEKIISKIAKALKVKPEQLVA